MCRHRESFSKLGGTRGIRLRAVGDILRPGRVGDCQARGLRGGAEDDVADLEELEAESLEGGRIFQAEQAILSVVACGVML